MRTWSARAFALLALAGAAIAVVVAVSGVDSETTVTGDQAQAAMIRLNQANAALGDRLDALKPGDSPSGAQDAVRSTAALAKGSTPR